MYKSLENAENLNLYANFGIIEDLQEEELITVDGGAGHGYQSGSGCQGTSSTISGGGWGYSGGC